MKKVQTWFALIAVLAVCCTVWMFPAQAQASYDHRDLRNLDGFEYSADGSWSYGGQHDKIHGRSGIRLGAAVFGEGNETEMVVLHMICVVADYEPDMLPRLTEALFLVENTLYTCKLLDLDDSMYATFITPSNKRLLEDIARAKKMTVKVQWADGSASMDFTADELGMFGTVVRNIVKYGLADKVGPASISMSESECPIIIER